MTTVAIVGGGIAGLAAARVLADKVRVVLIEGQPNLGGHVRTVKAPDGTAIDCGFIVFNRSRYPGFTRMLAELGVRSRPSEMSFGVSATDESFAYSTRTVRSLFADPKTIFDRGHRRLVVDIVNFLRTARGHHARGDARGLTLASYLDRLSASPHLRERFVYPLAGALWSTGRGDVAEFPAEVMLAFLAVHGMLRPAFAPRWRTVEGGAKTYVVALRRSLAVEFRLGADVVAVSRGPRGVEIALADRTAIACDRVVIAAPADRALAMLAKPTAREATDLAAIRYLANDVVVHTDAAAMPATRAARAAWNYRVGADDGEVEVTYWSNRLQRLVGPTDYFVTLNPRRPIDSDQIIHRTEMRHPCFDLSSLSARRRLARDQGTDLTYFAGAHFGFGFHEDGYRSGASAAFTLLADLAARETRARRAA